MHQDHYNYLGMAILAADAYVVFEVFQSRREMPEKLLWTLLVVLCPVIGIIIYLIFSNRQKKTFSLTL